MNILATYYTDLLTSDCAQLQGSPKQTAYAETRRARTLASISEHLLSAHRCAIREPACTEGPYPWILLAIDLMAETSAARILDYWTLDAHNLLNRRYDRDHTAWRQSHGHQYRTVAATEQYLRHIGVDLELLAAIVDGSPLPIRTPIEALAQVQV